MSEQMDLFAELSKPFPAEDIEWRIQRSGVKNGRVWAIAIPYVTNRAIQYRLDSVFGIGGWKNEIREINGGFMCGISFWCKEKKEWVTKWDGADKTNIEAIKGGISGAMKRAAVQLGIGRYLYNLNATFAECFENNSGQNRGVAKGKNGQRDTYFSWNPPILPAWALPEQQRPVQQQQPVQEQQTVQEQQPVQDQEQPVFEQHHVQHQHQQPVVEVETQPVQDNVQSVKTSAKSKKPDVQLTGKIITPIQVTHINNALSMANKHPSDLCRYIGVPMIGKMDQAWYPVVMHILKKSITEPVIPKSDTPRSPRIQPCGVMMSNNQRQNLTRYLRSVGLDCNYIADNHGVMALHQLDSAYYAPWMKWLEYQSLRQKKAA